jgi:superfamily II DNA helicase RecQ
VKILDGIFARLGAEPVPKEALQKALRLEGDLFDKALEKLWIHGGAAVDFAENVARGQDGWRELYIAQSAQKQQQLDLMLRFAESNECRMAAMVRHFGDLADSRKACGVCDFCAPDDCVGQRFRAPGVEEREVARRAIGALRGTEYRPTGKLHAELFADGSCTRDAFEEVLGALARAGLVRIAAAVFEKDGRSIPYRKAALTAAGEALEEGDAPEFQMKVAVQGVRKRKGKKKAAKSRKKAAVAVTAPKAVKAAAASPRLEEALRAWRLGEAKKRGVPAFRIFTDATLKAIAERRPATGAELLGVPGIGMKAVENYGAVIFRLVAQAGA